ncbi:MAG: MFS transporter [Coriobacteriaceae bacterium]|nr:MFS transporter [Coriobacteriaceae bacterium]
MGARFSFSTPELTRQVRRLVAARLFLYLGAMSSYFIGVMGTLTFAMGAGVGDNAIAVALLNLCMVVGQMKGGGLLDRLGPRAYFRLAAAGLIASGLLYQVLGTSVVGVYLGGAVFGLTWGISDIIPRAFPAYLTGQIDELKRINSLLTLMNNIATVVGPLVGGAIALVAPTQTVFLFMVLCTALACIPGFGLRALRTPAGDEEAALEGDGGRAAAEPGECSAGDGAAGKPGDRASDKPTGGVSAGFATIFGSSVLTLLFWSTLLSFMGYGAFDPLESLFYRDVLHVGAEWMGWLSALSGVGGLIGAALAGVMPTRLINVRSMLVVLLITGVGSLVYVSTPFVAVACVGQFILGVAFAAFGPISNTLVQVHAPLDQVGRVNAAMGAGYNLAGAFPLLCAPALAHVFGVQGTLIAAGVAVAVVPLVILAMRRGELDELVAAERAAEQAGE